MAPLGDIPIGLHAKYLMCWSMAVFPKETPICLPKVPAVSLMSIFFGKHVSQRCYNLSKLIFIDIIINKQNDEIKISHLYRRLMKRYWTSLDY